MSSHDASQSRLPEPAAASGAQTTSQPPSNPAVRAEPIEGSVDAHLEPDNDGVDEGIGEEDAASNTTSLKSSLLDFEIENGRQYHAYKKGAYAFPNDEDELDRMDLEHHIFKMLLGRNTLVQVQDPQRILDLGTGTGIWAIEIADEYPTAEVIGVDLSPVQPDLVPPNCSFLVDDYEQDWIWPENHFDVIHGRLMLASVTDYPKLFAKVYRHLKPGGWFEIVDIDPESYCDDGSLTTESPSLEWGRLLKDGCANFGRRVLALDEYKDLYNSEGFAEVEEHRYKRPHNTWPKDPWLKRVGAVSNDRCPRDSC